MSSSTKKKQKNRKQGRFDFFPPEAFLGIIGGTFLAYMVLVSHQFSHPWHYIYSVIGGMVGYIFSLIWIHRPSEMRPKRGQGPGLNYVGIVLMIALFILVFVLIGYVLPE